jgi:hypothetical protein
MAYNIKKKKSGRLTIFNGYIHCAKVHFCCKNTAQKLKNAAFKVY